MTDTCHDALRRRRVLRRSLLPHHAGKDKTKTELVSQSCAEYIRRYHYTFDNARLRSAGQGSFHSLGIALPSRKAYKEKRNTHPFRETTS